MAAAGDVALTAGPTDNPEIITRLAPPIYVQ